MRLVKCKKASKLLNVDYKEFLETVKTVLITQDEIKAEGFSLRLIGERQGEKIVKGEVHVFNENGHQLILSDARCCTDAYGSMTLLEGKLIG